MNRCPAQRDGDSGKVYRTALSTKYRTAAAPATSQDSLRRIRQLYAMMEWSTDGVQAHRRQCHYPGRSGQVQTVQRVTKFETGPMGGSPTRPGHQRVKSSTWCDDGSPASDGMYKLGFLPGMALDRPWTVYRAIWRARTWEVLGKSRVNRGSERGRNHSSTHTTSNQRLLCVGSCHK